MYSTLIIGLSNRGKTWAEAVQAHPDLELTGVADIDEKVLTTRSEELKLPARQCHLDYHQALSSGDYQTAIVVTPNHLHYQIAKDVLEAGIHCVLEKPFTEQLAHAEELVRLAEDGDLTLVIGHNYRFKAPFRRIAQDFRKYGRLIGAEVSFHRYRPPRYDHERRMRFPLLYIQGIHHLDLLISLLPAPIEQIYCRHHLPSDSLWRSPSVCHIILGCGDQTVVSYRGSYECRGEQTPYNGLWRFEFERGDLVLDVQGKLWEIREDSFTLLYEPGEEKRSADELLLDTVIQSVEEGQEAPTSGRNNLATLRLLLAVIAEGESS